VAVTFLLDEFTQGDFDYLLWYGLVLVLETFRVGPRLKIGLIGITVLWLPYMFLVVKGSFRQMVVGEAIRFIIVAGALFYLVLGFYALLALGTVALFRRIFRSKPKT
ncbi:MAG: hypothetical protein ABJA67_16700, partial [Chthonomonadales bacterium]